LCVGLRAATALGLVAAAVGVVALTCALVMCLAGRAGSGQACTVGAVGLLFGLLLLAIGIQGEYILGIYDRVRCRPPFLIERVIRKDEPPQDVGDKSHRRTDDVVGGQG
jgi:hypothetical protein